LIGDPKQAIYGFRGGDVEAYLKARRLIERQASPRVPLFHNFRSTATMIEAHNRIFEQKAEPPFFRGEIRYDKDVENAPNRDYSAYAAEEPRGALTPPVYLLTIKPKGEKLAMPELRRGLGWQIAREVRKLVKGPGLFFPGEEGAANRIKHKDIFILTATNKDAVEISRFLRMAGIPFSFYKQEGLFQTSEAREIRDVLAAVDQLDDAGLRGRAWITPFFDVPLAALPELADLPDSDPLIERLTAWNDLASRRRFETLFARILDESGVIRRELFLTDSERALTNYLHLCEILLEEARATGCGLADLVTTLTAYINETRTPPGEDRDVQRLESDRDAVQVMTIHKSKGLEAAAVFVYGGFFLQSKKYWHEFHAGGRRMLYLGENSDAARAAAAEAAEERERVFYVALTRAKARLYLPMVPAAVWPNTWKGGYKRVNDRLNELEKELPEEDFKRLFRVIEFQDAPIGSGPGDELPPPVDLTKWRPPPDLLSHGDDFATFDELKRRHAGYEVTSYSRMKPSWEADINFGSAERDRESAVVHPPEGALPGGTSTGTFLHEILELVPLESLAQVTNWQEWMKLVPVAKVVDDALVHNGIDQTHAGTAAELAYLALTSAIPIESHRSIPGLGSCPNTLREMEFLFPWPEITHPPLDEAPRSRRKLVVERGFIKGFVDLVVEHEGMVYFADWKSDVLECYDPELLNQHVKKHYDLQAKLYSLALVKALGVQSEGQYGARFGGLVYVFLRGLPTASPDRPAVYFARPTWENILTYEKEIVGHGAATRSRGVRS
jgi:exodeoxyribonuclease V beta subunit